MKIFSNITSLVSRSINAETREESERERIKENNTCETKFVMLRIILSSRLLTSQRDVINHKWGEKKFIKRVYPSFSVEEKTATNLQTVLITVSNGVVSLFAG